MLKPAVLPLAIFLSPAAFAAVSEHNFNTFPSGGTGWAGNWSPISATTGVSTVAPLNGGGSYLTVSTTNPASAANHGVRRQIDSSVIDTTQPYTVSFDFRLDDPDLSTYTSFNDRLHIGMSTAADTGTNTNFSWNVGAVGTINSKNWSFYNRYDGSYDVENLHNSGVALAVSTAYAFFISVDPASQTYSATVTNLTTNATATQSGLKFRNQSSAATNYLLIGFYSDAGESRAISVDNLVITGVPEPSALLLVGASAILGFRRQRRS